MTAATTSMGLISWLVVSWLAQSCGPPSHGSEEILISTIALRGVMAKRDLDRIFLRDTTQSRGSVIDPMIAMVLRDVPDDVKADFDSRNKRPTTIKPGIFQFPAQLKLLRQEEELKLGQEGRACEPNAPIAFFSRPGLNSRHDMALVYVGSVCDDLEEYGSFLILKKSHGEWVVSRHLAELLRNIEHFPAPERQVRK